jgi:hypothetical protein
VWALSASRFTVILLIVQRGRQMDRTVKVSIDEKGQVVITQDVMLVDYCVRRAQALRAMFQVLSNSQGIGHRANAAPSVLSAPLTRLIREHIDELEPLIRALDQRAYEKGFEDGQQIGAAAKRVADEKSTI